MVKVEWRGRKDYRLEVKSKGPWVMDENED